MKVRPAEREKVRNIEGIITAAPSANNHQYRRSLRAPAKLR